nr:ATP-binding protein [Desulfosarcinaceae bacterium]
APPGDPVIPWLEKMENASLQAKGLTQQLLTFSRGGEPVKKVVSLAETLQNTISFSLRGSNVVSNMEIDDNLPPVEVDEGQIGQVVHNLILNANQAMPDGGVIHVRLTAEALPGLNSLKLPAGDYLRLTIADQGCGIPREHVSKIFDPYFTTKSEGSGLGLTAAYAIIKKHQGSLSVTSTPGKGTRFHVHLPVSRGAEQRRVSVDPAIASGKGRVLLMDDEYFIRDMAQLMISKLGYHISVVENGHQACNVYQKSLDNGTPFDIVILDLTIPGGMGGRETLAQLKQIDPEVKAVVSSGYSNDPIMANFIEYGFVDIVTKPYSLEDMSRVLQRVTRLQSATCA